VHIAWNRTPTTFGGRIAASFRRAAEMLEGTHA
jgi:hypothetical protein